MTVVQQWDGLRCLSGSLSAGNSEDNRGSEQVERWKNRILLVVLADAGRMAVCK